MFLRSNPNVFIVENEYQITCVAKDNGLFWIEILGEKFFEENNGVLSTEKNYAKISVDKSILDRACEYTVCYKKTIERKLYASKMGEVQQTTFCFKPIKNDSINAYHIADIHGSYKNFIKCANYFGDKLDLLIVNGDISEFSSENDYELALDFISSISKGKVPVICVRGNHDTRGKLVEKYTDYFPSVNKNTYYLVNVGKFKGIVLDLGEDKPDDYIYNKEESALFEGVSAYGGVNDFQSYRKKQLQFLKKLQGCYDFAICHIPTPAPSFENKAWFNFNNDLYREFSAELERLGVKFMLSGHIHETVFLQSNDPRSKTKHDFLVVIGADLKSGDCKDNDFVAGTAIEFLSNKTIFKFTDRENNILEQMEIKA